MDITGRGVASTVADTAARHQVFKVVLLVIKMLVSFVVTLEGPFVRFLFWVVFTYVPVTHAARVIVALQHNRLNLLEFFRRDISGISFIFGIVLVRFVRHFNELYLQYISL